MNYTPEEFETCLKVLQEISADPSVMNENLRFKGLIAKIHRWGKKNEGRNVRKRQNAENRRLKAATAIVRGQASAVALPAPDATAHSLGRLHKTNACYICKQPYQEIHFFYHRLCPDCAARNFQKRQQRADLGGRVALITGGRIKIGFQTALRMLRDGARVIVTTRFPKDCAERFGAEEDFDAWRRRLQIYGLDLRVPAAVESFAERLADTEAALDILINNASQTIKRPLEFYRHLLEKEGRPYTLRPAGAQGLMQISPETPVRRLEGRLPEPGHPSATAAYFPDGFFDGDGQQLDLRPVNSWMLRLDEVSTVEMLEAQLVNAVAPFILNCRLKPLLIGSRFARRFIVNVSAMEGQFNRSEKTVFHPHTNMAKAALNMMTRTSAADYARDGIFMNSVDTGWITDENPHPKGARLRDEGAFYTPLDTIDGAARIYDPIVRGIENDGEPHYGHFLKDYDPYPW